MVLVLKQKVQKKSEITAPHCTRFWSDGPTLTRFTTPIFRYCRIIRYCREILLFTYVEKHFLFLDLACVACWPGLGVDLVVLCFEALVFVILGRGGGREEEKVSIIVYFKYIVLQCQCNAHYLYTLMHRSPEDVVLLELRVGILRGGFRRYRHRSHRI